VTVKWDEEIVATESEQPVAVPSLERSEPVSPETAFENNNPKLRL
jgi:hypothetical protein